MVPQQVQEVELVGVVVGMQKRRLEAVALAVERQEHIVVVVVAAAVGVRVRRRIAFGAVPGRAAPLLLVVAVRSKTCPVRPAWVQKLSAEWAVLQVPLALAK